MHNAKLAGRVCIAGTRSAATPPPSPLPLRVRTGFGNAVLAVLVLRMLVAGVEGSR